MVEEKLQFDDQMFLIFITGFIGLIILIWVLYYLRKQRTIPTTFPCQCSKCQEKRKRMIIKNHRITSSTIFQFIIIGILSYVFIHNIIKINSSNIIAPQPTFDPYVILGISSTSTDKEIRSAYRKLSLKYHPDKNKEEGAEEMFIQVTKAYETLTDPSKLKAWKETGREADDKIETKGIGLPIFLTLEKNRKLILGFYIVIIVIVFPVSVWLMVKKCNKKDNNNLTIETNAIFMQLINSNLNFPSMIEVVSLANEVREVVVIRPNDKNFLPVIQKKIKEEFIKKPTYNVPEAVKAQILIGAHLSRLHEELPSYLRDDLDSILEVIPTVLHGMVSVMMGKKNLNGIWQCIRLNAMITQACGENDDFLQLPDFNESGKVFGKNMTFERITKMTPEERMNLINEKIDCIEVEKQHKVIEPKKQRSEVKKRNIESMKEKVKRALDEKAIKEGKKPKFNTKDTDEHKTKEIKESTEKHENSIEENIKPNDNQLVNERRKQIINFFNYYPTNITFIVRAMSITGTRKVIAGVPILVTINGYRYPRNENGEIVPQWKSKLDDILNREKEELPDEPDDAEELLKSTKEDFDKEEDEIDPEIPDVEIVHEPPKDVYVHNPYCPNTRLERWWFIITDVRNQFVLNATHGYIPISELPFITKIYLPSPKEEGSYVVLLHIICDSYLHCEWAYPIKFTVIPRPVRKNNNSQQTNQNEEEEMSEEEGEEEEESDD
ncbi:hypothetical protein ENUP19_0099G0036 [Entamoeba nuttalli]|uniref:J domain-containing protein n=1 Tax=Entamoeba nuttalli TaxID=412467 RepID=A0ABQ0DHQ3_9EUKA